VADEAEPARAGTTLLVLAPPSDWSCLLQYDRAGAVPKVVSESDSDSHPTLKMMATVSIALDEVGYEDEAPQKHKIMVAASPPRFEPPCRLFHRLLRQVRHAGIESILVDPMDLKPWW